MDEQGPTRVTCTWCGAQWEPDVALACQEMAVIEKAAVVWMSEHWAACPQRHARD